MKEKKEVAEGLPEIVLVEMQKAGEEPIEVHPSTVKAHVAAGWHPL